MTSYQEILGGKAIKLPGAMDGFEGKRAIGGKKKHVHRM
jgi:hypothetical protein